MPEPRAVATHRAYVALGANLGEPQAVVERAIDALGELGTVEARSRLYRSKPWGGVEQPDFVNAVVALRTMLEPVPLLRALQQLERRLGRLPGVRWGPRTIDLDLLTFDDVRSHGPLVLPHPRMSERAFVLVPLAEIDPVFAAVRDALPQEQLETVVSI